MPTCNCHFNTLIAEHPYFVVLGPAGCERDVTSERGYRRLGKTIDYLRALVVRRTFVGALLRAGRSMRIEQLARG